MKQYLKGLSKISWFFNQFHFGTFKSKVLCVQKNLTDLEIRYNNKKLPIDDLREGDIILFRNSKAFSHWILPGKFTQAGVLVKKCREVLIGNLNRMVYMSLFDFLVYCTDFIIIRLPLSHHENDNFVKRIMSNATNPRNTTTMSEDVRFLGTELIFEALRPYHKRMELYPEYRSALLFSEYKTYTPDSILSQIEFRIICTSISEKEQLNFENIVNKKRSLALRLKPRRFLTT